MIPKIEIVTIDLDALDLDDETRAWLEGCLPDEPVDLLETLTDERIAEAMVAAYLVEIH